MGRVFLFAILGASALACAPANTAGEAEKAASDNASLDDVQKKRNQLVERLEKAPRGDREQCEFSAGDCLVLVGERRERLASQHGLMCGQRVEPARRSACIADGLRAAGKAPLAKEFYGFESWCVERVLACTADREDKAVLAAQDHERAARKREVVSSDRGTDAWNAVEVAHARVQYLESTLPPNVEVNCTDQAESCTARVAEADEAFQAELAREDFDLERATASYVEARSVEANCKTPVFECLKQALAPHGMFPPSESLLQKNFSLLKKRQELTRGVSPEAQADCLSTPSADHQDAIVAAFTAYAKEPVLYFRMQLEKAFSAMHQAQVTCLAAQPKVLPESPERSALSTP